MQRLTGFVPIASPQSKILILGSMPSGASLDSSAYYAHPRNTFWPILFALFNRPCPICYDARCALLFEKDIALWDSAASCIRPGSLDSNMRAIALNDFDAFFAQHKNIGAVFFNGAQAQRLFLRGYKHIAQRLCCTLLPSTSPAAASVSFASKLAAWQAVKAALEAIN